MFRSKEGKTVIGQGFTIVGRVSAEGLVQVNGRIEGELNCHSLVVSPGAEILGSVTAEHIEVNGTIQGPVHGGDVVLRSRAHVVGDIHHRSLTIGKGAYFEGRSMQKQTVEAISPSASAKKNSSLQRTEPQDGEAAIPQPAH